MMYNQGTKIWGTFISNPELLRDPGRIHDFLKATVSIIEMTALGYHVYDVPTSVKSMGKIVSNDEGGITGIAVISTSHIAIHTWPEESAARFDVDSCRTFDSKDVVDTIKKFFESSDILYENYSYETSGKFF